MNARFTAEELARRRNTSRWIAWALGAIALSLYAIGFYIQR